MCEKSDGTFGLHGITSFGAGGCAEGDPPTVFTRVTTHLDWIELVTGGILVQPESPISENVTLAPTTTTPIPPWDWATTPPGPSPDPPGSGTTGNN